MISRYTTYYAFFIVAIGYKYIFEKKHIFVTNGLPLATDNKKCIVIVFFIQS